MVSSWERPNTDAFLLTSSTTCRESERAVNNTETQAQAEQMVACGPQRNQWVPEKQLLSSAWNSAEAKLRKALVT